MSEHDETSGANEYLWDPSAPADEEVTRLEALLAHARVDARPPRPLPLTDLSRRPRRWGRWALGAAAAGLVWAMLLGGWLAWRWDWPAGRPWSMTLEAVAVVGRSPQALPLTVGETVSVPPEKSAAR